MATRTDNLITLTRDELLNVLEALNDTSRENYKFWRNQRHQAATRESAKLRADKFMIVRDALVNRMYSWS